MTRFTLPVLLGGMMLMSAGAQAQAPALPGAETILDRYVEVTGGKAAYQQHASEVLTGTISFPEQGLTGRLTRYAVTPDKEYSIVELGPIGKIESGVAGGVAWERSAILGPRIKNGDEKDQAIRQARFNAPLDWRKTFTKVETAGTEAVKGEDSYKLVLTPKTGRPEYQFYSKTSGLLLKTMATAVSPMGEVAVEVEVSDYKKFGGVLYPTRSRQKAGGQEMEIVITSVTLDEPVPPEYFALPPDIQALAAKSADK